MQSMNDIEVGSVGRRALARIADLRHLGWDLGVRAMEKLAGHRRGDTRPDVRLRASARDLVQRGRAIGGEVEALAQSVMRAGAYAGREEANRAVNAVLESLRERVPPDLLQRLSEHLPEAEARHLRTSAAGPAQPPASQGAGRR